MTNAEQWVSDHQETSSDYNELVARLRQGEVVEFMMIFDGNFKTGTVLHRASNFGEVFSFHFDSDEFQCAGEEPFLADCFKYGLVFSVERDFLKDTKRMLEITANAAVFRPITVPLNTLADVNALLALMGDTEALN